MNIVAIIPIKYNSTRVPGKNFRTMNGKPLFYYILNTLLKSKYVNEIIIDIDDSIIEREIKKYFSDVKFYYRRKELHGGEISTNRLLLQLIDDLNLNADLYIHTHVTNPLLRIETIDNAILKYIENKNVYDSLFTVNKLYSRFYDKNGVAINHNINELIPTQNLEPYYEENSCLYIIPHDILLKYKRRIGNKPYLYPISKYESQDIDWEEDFEFTEFIMKYDKKNIKKYKSILITGSSGDIGKGISKKFKSKGWYIIGIDIEDINTNKYLNKYIKCDLSNVDEIDDIDIEINNLDILVNNAAIQINKKIIDTELNDWNKTLNINLTAPFLLSKKFFNHLKNTNGNIINISSIHAINTSENISAYAVSKAALLSLTRSMAIEYGKDNINVNSILPGAIDTGMLRKSLCRENMTGENIEDKMYELCKKHVMNKIGNPKDIAETVYFLCTKSKYILGETIIIDGGATIKLSTE